MSDSETKVRLRAELSSWIEANLSAMLEDSDTLVELPVSVDFMLTVALEDAADPDSDTWYSLVSSGTSHYRKVGLIQCTARMLLRDDQEVE